MKMTRRESLLIGLIAALVAVWATGAQARGRPVPRGVRAEVARLEARVAQLESAVDFQLRRGALLSRPAFLRDLCMDPCAADSDGDGTGDCEDPCPCQADHADGDGDGTPDCLDPCPEDAADACIHPCRTDSDGDGVADCEDPCPWDPSAPHDGDGDGVPDCADPCPGDRSNDCHDPCPLDSDGDGEHDCMDPCPWGEDSGRPCVTTGVTSLSRG